MNLTWIQDGSLLTLQADGRPTYYAVVIQRRGNAVVRHNGSTYKGEHPTAVGAKALAEGLYIREAQNRGEKP